MITVKNIWRIYGEGETQVEALKRINLKIQSGEFVAIMGHSGSGKSTLLHQLGLLDQPSKGTIFIDKKEVVSIPEKFKSFFRLNKLGYVFQEYALVEELTAEENVYLPSLMAEQPKKECIIKAHEVLEKVGLKGKEKRLPNQLSGGEQQRVAIARSLTNNPKIIFADEPCANLDTENSRQILELFKELNKEFKQTIVMVTHEDWHKKYVDRIIKLKDGKIISDEKSKH